MRPIARIHRFVTGMLAVVAVFAASNARSADPNSRPQPALGSMVSDFRLPTAAGNDVSLYGFAGKKAAVIVFTGTDCPLGNLYVPRLNELAKACEAQGVVVLAVDSNAGLTPEKAREYATEHELKVPLLLDGHQRVADLLGVDRTCTAVVIDERARIRYRGPIDDQYTYTARKPEPTKTWLRDAIESVVAGRTASVPEAEVLGCPIQRAASTEPDPTSPLPDPEPIDVGPVNYAKHVAPILQAKCQGCHRPGQIGPFTLETFADAKKWAQSIDEVVTDGRMPPWSADPRFGTFANDRSLSPREKATLLAWVEQGMPEGDSADMPAPRTFPEGEWSIGRPDAVFSIPEPVKVKADGTLAYQWFVVPTGFTEDKWVRAIEVKPGDRRVVHHVLVFVGDNKSGALRRIREDGEGAGGGQIAGYVPGDDPTVYPEGMAAKIPAGSSLLFQMHYTPIGKPSVDQTRIAFQFADGPPEREVRTHGIFQTDFAIPPGAPSHEVRSRLEVPADVRILSLWPHMHLRGKDFRIELTEPSGAKRTLLSVPHYDFNWQSTYQLAEPLKVAKGSVIECIAHFDNSPGNPHNPNPAQRVTWGPQTYDEMMIGYIDYVMEDPGAELARLAPAGLSADRRAATAFTQFDKDGDGRITREEFPRPVFFARIDANGDGAITREELETAIKNRSR